MNLTPFQASKLVEWADHVQMIGSNPDNMPRGIAEVDTWLERVFVHGDEGPFPKFDTEQPYTWEG